MSLVASDTEELSGLTIDPAPLQSAEPSEAKADIDTKLLLILSKIVEELGFKWSLQEGRGPSASSALTSVKSAEEKVYERLPPLDKTVDTIAPVQSESGF